MTKLRKILENIVYFVKGFAQGFKENAVSYIEMEERELENIFALILMSSFIGLPSPPTTLVIKLFPYMARELIIMQSKSRRLDDLLGEVAGMFEIG